MIREKYCTCLDFYLNVSKQFPSDDVSYLNFYKFLGHKNLIVSQLVLSNNVKTGF